MPSLPVLPVIFSLILNESVIELATVKSVIALLASKAGSSLQYCQKSQMFLNNYHYIPFSYTLTLLHQSHEHHLL